ncbi:IF factor, partial [Pardalotus punctatus]|nr:IF factor [Pardalotus punctatus]
KNNGMIGNIYSMGLALQALETSSEFYAPRKWDSSQACNVVYNHDYQNPMAIAQVLPPLVGKSYLNAGSLGCAATNGMAPSQRLPLSPIPGTIRAPTWSHTRGDDTPVLRQMGGPCLPLSHCTGSITISYTITNTLKGEHFSYSTSVTVPSGSTLLQAMEVAEKKNPEIF